MQADISRWVQRPLKQQRQQQLADTTNAVPDPAPSGGLLSLLSKARSDSLAPLGSKSTAPYPTVNRPSSTNGASDPAKAALMRLAAAGPGCASVPGRGPSPPASRPQAGRAPAGGPWRSGPQRPVKSHAPGPRPNASRVFEDADSGDGALVVLGDRSKRAAAKRAGLDSERLEQIRAQRARRNESLSERFNYWDEGGGTWDADTIGIDGADDIGMGWEGRGTKAIGRRM